METVSLGLDCDMARPNSRTSTQSLDKEAHNMRANNLKRTKRLGTLMLAGWLIMTGLLGGCGGSNPPIPPDAQSLPNMGQEITPLAIQGSKFENLNPDLSDNPDWLAGQAVTTVVSPDHKTLLVLTSGFNRVYRTDGVPDALGTYFNWQDSQEYVFIYDISANTPVKKQVVKVPNTYSGIVFDPSGTAFYVSSGMGDLPFASDGSINPAKSGGDNVHIFTLSAATGTWQHAAELALGHTAGLGLDTERPTGEQIPVNERVSVSPCAAGVAVSKDGKTLVVANYFNDSVTVFNGGLGNWSQRTELDLRPGKSDASKVGIPGGEYPFWVAVKGNGSSATAYVSSVRDREIVVVALGATPAVMTASL